MLQIQLGSQRVIYLKHVQLTMWSRLCVWPVLVCAECVCEGGEDKCIPLLRDVFDAFPNTPVNIDIKANNNTLIKKVRVSVCVCVSLCVCVSVCLSVCLCVFSSGLKPFSRVYQVNRLYYVFMYICIVN